MLRPACLTVLALVLSLVGQATPVRATDSDSDLLGTWQGTSGAGGFTEIWQIKTAKGDWSVAGVFLKDKKEVGAFRGKDVKVADSTLTFVQEYTTKPDPNWQDNTAMSVTAKGDQLTFVWKNNAGTGTVTMTRLKTSDDFLGTWEGTSGAGGFKEIWTIKQAKGGFSVSGVFKKGDEEVGSFRGTRLQFANGTLAFIQQYVKKPDPTWQNGTVIQAQVAGDKLTFVWKTRTATGTDTLTRVKKEGPIAP